MYSKTKLILMFISGVFFGVVTAFAHYAVQALR